MARAPMEQENDVDNSSEAPAEEQKSGQGLDRLRKFLSGYQKGSSDATKDDKTASPLIANPQFSTPQAQAISIPQNIATNPLASAPAPTIPSMPNLPTITPQTQAGYANPYAQSQQMFPRLTTYLGR